MKPIGLEKDCEVLKAWRTSILKKNRAVLAEWYAGDCERELQVATGPDEWVNNGTLPLYLEDYIYRLKQNTITVNGIEVPEPVRKPLEDGQRYWSMYFGGNAPIVDHLWQNSNQDKNRLDRGVIHLTKESARQHFEAMLAPSKIGGVS